MMGAAFASETFGTIKVEQRKIADLIPFARNSRTHSDAQVAQIAASIREFGWTNPILIDGANGIIAGHGRLAAARKLGMDALPVIVLDHLTDAQKRALVIADNKLALNAGWDDETYLFSPHADPSYKQNDLYSLHTLDLFLVVSFFHQLNLILGFFFF